MTGKIQRKYLAHYILVGEKYELLGNDLEEFSPEMNAQVETKRNILGHNGVVISGYEKTAEVETYFAEAGMPLFEKLQAIIDDDLVLDDLKVQVVEVQLWQTTADNCFYATQEDAYIEVLSYGGDCNGYQIPFKLHYTGNKEKGTFSPESKTFSPGRLEQ